MFNNDKQSKRMFGLVEAPTYYPTDQEFKDPLAFIQKIRSEAQKFGICKIVPPPSFKPEFQLDYSFEFRTRFQKLNSMEGTIRLKKNYLEKLDMYYQQQNIKFRIPSFGGKHMDLYLLRQLVEKYGGYHQVTSKKQWSELTRVMGMESKKSISRASHVKQAYLTWILPFEQFINDGIIVAKSSGTCKSEEHSNESDFSEDQEYCIITEESCLAKREAALKRRQYNISESQSDTSSESSEPNSLPNDESSDTSELSNGSDKPRRRSIRIVQSAVSRPTRPLQLGKRKHISENPNFKKRLAKTDLAIGMKQLPSKMQPLAPKKHLAEQNEICVICSKNGSMNEIIICDDCKRPWHLFCLIPELTIIPDSEWFCKNCIEIHGDSYGFEERKELRKLGDFTRFGDEFKYNWFMKQIGKEIVAENECEKEYWRLMTSPFEDVEVEYGADLHTSTHGSAFPTRLKASNDPISSNPWNVNNISTADGSLFQNINNDISGMMVPWIYIGMVFSSFCWHVEDHYTYSINYNHWGDTKTWYGIPDTSADKFEETMRQQVPELFEKNPDLLFHLTTLLSPETLKENDVSVYAVDQRAGEFVITFPRAYHAGFNHGINCAEAVNFAPADWLPFGEDCARFYSTYLRNPVFSHDELVVRTAGRQMNNFISSIYTCHSLNSILQREYIGRSHVESLGVSIRTVETKLTVSDGKDQCFVCKSFCFLSSIVCENHPENIVCLEHASENFCVLGSCCKKSLRIFYSSEKMKTLQDECIQRAYKSLISLPSHTRPNQRPGINDLELLLNSIPKEDKFGIIITDVTKMLEKCYKWNSLSQEITTRTIGKRNPKKSLSKIKELIDQAIELPFFSSYFPKLEILYQEASEIEKKVIEWNSMGCGTKEEIYQAKERSFIIGVNIPILNQLPINSSEVETFLKKIEQIDISECLVEDVKKFRASAILFSMDQHPLMDIIENALAKSEQNQEKAALFLSGELRNVDDIETFLSVLTDCPKTPEMRTLYLVLDEFNIWKKKILSLTNCTFSDMGDIASLIESGSQYETNDDIIQTIRDEVKQYFDWENTVSLLFFSQKDNPDIGFNCWMNDLEKILADCMKGDLLICYCNSNDISRSIVCIQCGHFYHESCLGIMGNHEKLICPSCAIEPYYKLTNKPSFHDVKKLARCKKLPDTFIKYTGLKRFQRLVDQFESWLTEIEAHHIRLKPNRSYLKCILRRLYSLPFSCLLSRRIERLLSNETRYKAATICICNQEYDPRLPTFICISCNQIFHFKCMNYTFNGGNPIYSCTSCSSQSCSVMKLSSSRPIESKSIRIYFDSELKYEGKDMNTPIPREAVDIIATQPKSNSPKSPLTKQVVLSQTIRKLDRIAGSPIFNPNEGNEVHQTKNVSNVSQFKKNEIEKPSTISQLNSERPYSNHLHTHQPMYYASQHEQKAYNIRHEENQYYRKYSSQIQPSGNLGSSYDCRDQDAFQGSVAPSFRSSRTEPYYPGHYHYPYHPSDEGTSYNQPLFHHPEYAYIYYQQNPLFPQYPHYRQ